NEDLKKQLESVDLEKKEWQEKHRELQCATEGLEQELKVLQAANEELVALRDANSRMNVELESLRLDKENVDRYVTDLQSRVREVEELKDRAVEREEQAKQKARDIVKSMMMECERAREDAAAGAESAMSEMHAAEVRALEGLNEDLKKQLESVDLEKKEWQEKHRELQCATEGLEQELKVLQAANEELVALRDANSRMNVELESTTVLDKENVDRYVTDLQSRVREVEELKDRAVEREEQAKQKARDIVKSMMMECERAREDAAAGAESAMSEMHAAEVRALEGLNEDLKKQLESVDLEKKEWQEKHRELQCATEGLEQELKVLQAANEELVALRDANSRMNVELESTHCSLNELNKSNSSLKGEVAVLKQMLSVEEERIEFIKDKARDIVNAVIKEYSRDYARGPLITEGAIYEMHAAEVRALEGLNEDLKKQLESVDLERKEWQEKHRELQCATEGLEQELKVLQAANEELVALRDANSRMNVELESLRLDKENVDRYVTDLQSRVREVEELKDRAVEREEQAKQKARDIVKSMMMECERAREDAAAGAESAMSEMHAAEVRALEGLNEDLKKQLESVDLEKKEWQEKHRELQCATEGLEQELKVLQAANEELVALRDANSRMNVELESLRLDKENVDRYVTDLQSRVREVEELKDRAVEREEQAKQKARDIVKSIMMECERAREDAAAGAESAMSEMHAAEVRALEGLNEDLKKQLESVDLERKEWQEKHRELQCATEGLEQELKVLQAANEELVALRDANSRMNVELESLRLDKENVDRYVTDLQSRVREVEELKDRAVEREEQAKQKARDIVKSMMMECERAREDAAAGAESAMSEMHAAEVRALEGLNEDLKKQLESVDLERKEWQEKHRELQCATEGLEQELKVLQAANEELVALRDANSRMNVELESTHCSLNELNKSNSSLKGEVAVLKQMLSVEEERIEFIKDKARDIVNAVIKEYSRDYARGPLITEGAIYEMHAAEVRALEGLNEDLKKQLESVDLERKEWQEKHRELQCATEGLEQELKVLQAANEELVALRDANSRMNVELESLRLDKENVDRYVTDLQSRVREVEELKDRAVEREEQAKQKARDIVKSMMMECERAREDAAAGAESAMSEMHAAEVRALEGLNEDLKKQLESVDLEKKEWQEKHRELQCATEGLEQELKVLQAANEELVALRDANSRMNVELESPQCDLEEVDRSVSSLKGKVPELEQLLDVADERNELTKDKARDIVNAVIMESHRARADAPPSSESAIYEMHAAEVRAFEGLNEDLKKQLESVDLERKEWQEKHRELQCATEGLEQELKVLQAANEELVALRDANSRMNVELESLRLDKENVDRYVTDLQSRVREVEELKDRAVEREEQAKQKARDIVKSMMMECERAREDAAAGAESAMSEMHAAEVRALEGLNEDLKKQLESVDLEKKEWQEKHRELQCATEGLEQELKVLQAANEELVALRDANSRMNVELES
ncbi:unnamed protein product, partial [Trypanosoma congolense IL3000]